MGKLHMLLWKYMGHKSEGSCIRQNKPQTNVLLEHAKTDNSAQGSHPKSMGSSRSGNNYVVAKKWSNDSSGLVNVWICDLLDDRLTITAEKILTGIINEMGTCHIMKT
jgi:hypothetical protein